MRVLYYCICEQRMPRWAYTFAQFHHSLSCLNSVRKKRRCRWRFRPNFVPAKVVALLLWIHSLIILPWDCGGSLLGPCLVLYYSGVLSSFAIILTRNREHGVLLYCLPTINVLWLFLTVPWIGLKCINEVLPDHTHSLFYGPLYESLVLIAYSSRKGSNETAHSTVSPEPWKSHWKDGMLMKAQPNFIGQFKKVWY